MRRSALIVCPVPTHPTKQDGDPNCHTVIFLIAGQRRKVKRELGCDQEVSERMKSLGQCGDDRLDLDRNSSQFGLVSGTQHEAGPWLTGGLALRQDLWTLIHDPGC